MRTDTAYTSPRHGSPASAESGAATLASRLAVARLRALLVVRGTSLHGYALEWAQRNGITDPADQARAYNTIRMAVSRWAHRTDAPPRAGTISARFLADLLVEVGDAPRYPAPSGGRGRSPRRRQAGTPVIEG